MWLSDLNIIFTLNIFKRLTSFATVVSGKTFLTCTDKRADATDTYTIIFTWVRIAEVN